MRVEFFLGSMPLSSPWKMLPICQVWLWLWSWSELRCFKLIRDLLLCFSTTSLAERRENDFCRYNVHKANMCPIMQWICDRRQSDILLSWPGPVQLSWQIFPQMDDPNECHIFCDTLVKFAWVQIWMNTYLHQAYNSHTPLICPLVLILG